MVREKLLFLCSRNRWRSPAAESLFKRHPRYEARSAGTENGARIRVSACHLRWADRIFCMERKHATRLRARFPLECEGRALVVLHVSDDYPSAEDPALLARLRSELAPHLPEL
jgi:predicted protein tyrosine phosphatase